MTTLGVSRGSSTVETGQICEGPGICYARVMTTIPFTSFVMDLDSEGSQVSCDGTGALMSHLGPVPKDSWAPKVLGVSHPRLCLRPPSVLLTQACDVTGQPFQRSAVCSGQPQIRGLFLTRRERGGGSARWPERLEKLWCHLPGLPAGQGFPHHCPCPGLVRFS